MKDRGGREFGYGTGLCLVVLTSGLCCARAEAQTDGATAAAGAGAGTSGVAAGSAPPIGAGPDIPVPRIGLVAPTPLLGTGENRGEVPAEVNTLAASDLARDGQPDALRSLEEQVGGVNLDFSSGNPRQPVLFYHGFEASPLQGSSEGLAVFVDGVRFNQAFGDTTNWDLIPDIAINRLDLEGANPTFGLNALGGSLNVRLKNGFTYHGGEIDSSGGSFGQVENQFEYGRQSGDEAVYVAGDALHEDGWRDLQSSDVYDIHSDLGFRNAAEELHLGLTGADTVLNGPGTAPVQLLAVDPAAQFTAPNLVANKYVQATLSANFDLDETTALQGNVYYDFFQQRVDNGNAPDDTPCGNGSGSLCQEPGVVSTTRDGVAIPDFLGGGPYSELDEQTTNTNGYGVSTQVTNTHRLFGLRNDLVAGVSFDGAQTEFSATSLIGGLTAVTRVFYGPGEVIDEPGSNTPVRVAVSDAYAGIFATDTLDLTSRLAFTLAGRFNNAEIDLADGGGGDLTGQHSYDQFNPAAGATYRITNWLSAYAGFSEANRAPTPAELSCASAAESCSLANFFVGDPDLKQVVARSWEAGLRGSRALSDTAELSYMLSFFHTDLDDDIVFINSDTLGRAFFSNVGQTRRQGIDTGFRLRTRGWSAYAQFSDTDATFRTGFVEAAGSNPVADASGDIDVSPGDHLPGIPAQQIKLGAECKVTDAWTVGLTGIAESGTYLFGDEANTNAKVPSFFVLDLNTRYQLTKRVQLFGLIQNLTDTRYATYGTFSPTSSVFLAQAPNATAPRSYNLAAPIGGFGGVKVTL